MVWVESYFKDHLVPKLYLLLTLQNKLQIFISILLCFDVLFFCCIAVLSLTSFSVLQMILEKKSKSLPKEPGQRENVQLSQSECSTALPGVSSEAAPTRKGQQEPAPPELNPPHVHPAATAGAQPAGASQSKDLGQRSQRSVMMYNPITHTTVQSGYPLLHWGGTHLGLLVWGRQSAVK